MPTALNRYDIEMIAGRAVSAFMDRNVKLNDSIEKIAKDQGLTSEQVARIVETSNTIANMRVVKLARETKQDPRQSFELADTKVVLDRLNKQMPHVKEAEEASVRSLADMFVVKVAHSNIAQPDFMKLADEAKTPKMSHMKAGDIAEAYLTGNDVSDQAFSANSLVSAMDEIHGFKAQIRNKVAALAEIAREARLDLAAAVDDTLRSGVDPSSVKEAMSKHSHACDHIIAIGHQVCDEVAAKLDGHVRFSKVAGNAVVDFSHPSLVGLCELMIADAESEVCEGVMKVAVEAEERLASDIKANAGSVKLAINLNTIKKTVGAMGSKAKAGVGIAGTVIGTGLAANDAAQRAKESTKRMKAMSMTPMVMPMKLAAESMEKRAKNYYGVTADSFTRSSGSGGFFSTLKNLNPGPKQIAAVAAGALTTAAVIGLADKASNSVSNIFDRSRRQKLFEELCRRYPDIKEKQPRSKELFDLMMKFAPGLGEHPMAIGDFLNRQLQYQSTSTEYLAALVDLQKKIKEGKTQGGFFSNNLGGIMATSQNSWLRGDS